AADDDAMDAAVPTQSLVDAQALYEHALALEASDAAAAEATYLQALAAAPDHEDAYLNLGAMLDAAHRHEDMLRLCDAALRHCPTSALLHFNRGVALDHLERLEEAAASYERSLELDPALADAHFNLAHLHQQAGDERAALRHYSAYRRLQR
ncbi:MAG TPA: tetratricopeptide repeat protein, partial [Ramlibacter sp.]|uniref:tetratricopeptide repeat protein n=1 Tax=Ramlibacter sp. TaxID=1917967 RepID=UPI002D7E634C